MNITFDNSYFELPEKLNGVYKMVLNGKWFYIGSSVNIKRRFSQWKHHILNGTPHNKNIRKLLPQINDVKFILLQSYPTGTDVKKYENEYLSVHFNDYNCLNRCPNAYNIKGRKRAIGESIMVKIRFGEKTMPIKIARFTLSGELIDIKPSIRAMAITLGDKRSKKSHISDVAKGKQSSHKGFMFKYVNDDGTFVEPPKFVRKQVDYAARAVKRINYKSSKPFYQIDKNGDIIELFHNAETAAKKIGCNRTSIWKILHRKGRLNYAKGFRFEYA